VIFLLIHSPLVPIYTMNLLAREFMTRGHEVVQPELSGITNSEHIQEIESILSAAMTPMVCVVYSGAGSYLSAIDPHSIGAYILLDSIFPIRTASRAARAGFEVRKQLSNHFELINNAANLANECLNWCRLTCR
jgi:hypothetical protein